MEYNPYFAIYEFIFSENPIFTIQWMSLPKIYRQIMENTDCSGYLLYTRGERFLSTAYEWKQNA